MKYIYAASASIAFTTPSFAQNIAAEAGLSTLGLYAAPVYEMNENIDIRVPLYFESQNYKSTEGGTTIDGKVTSESVGVMLDYYPSGSGFRISGGLTAGGNNFDASTASLEFDGTTYTSDFDLNIKQDKKKYRSRHRAWVHAPSRTIRMADFGRSGRPLYSPNCDCIWAKCVGSRR